MPSGLRPYFDHVWPLFWPWLIWNMVRVAAWQERTGREALMAVDCFGNIRLVRMADAPAAEDLYTYEAPLVPRWASAGLASDLPAGLSACPASSGDLRCRPVFLRCVSGDAPVCATPPRGPP